MSTGILLADDHEAARLGTQHVIENMALDIEIVGEATNGHQAVEMTAELQPDIVIMDIGMPVLNGIEATRMIKQKNPQTNVIALTMFKRKPMIVDMLKAGVSGYILKDNISEFGRQCENDMEIERWQQTFLLFVQPLFSLFEKAQCTRPVFT